jgi:microcystin-dependent protein
MSSPYLSELRIFSFNYAPKGWAMCNGQLMPINQNQAMFSLLGTTYGGNGQTTFGLPDLRGRVPIHFGNGHVQGETAGEQAHTLTMGEMAAHTHLVQGSGSAPNIATPANNFFASNTGFTPYGGTINEQMAPGACSSIGNSQPHNNMSPYLALTICIALVGIFPSRN